MLAKDYDELDISGRNWFFATEQKLISDKMRLCADGTVSGYGHPNERRWSLEGDRIRLISESGAVSSILEREISTEKPYFCFRGRFVLNNSNTTHTLSSVELNIRTYDLFDTLIARRCVRPHQIFRLVEVRSGIEGFCARRIEAENQIRRTDYSLDAIYQTLATLTGWPDDVVHALKLMEMNEELTNLYPIMENVSKVSKRDIIVSDMYLPESFVRRLLADKCGLDNRLYLRPRGKSTGRVWQEVMTKADVVLHTGDSRETDFDSPGRFGIPAYLVSQWKLTAAESEVADFGFSKLSLVMREGRLRSWHEDTAIRELQLAQSQFNFPLLFLGSIILAERIKDLGFEPFCFPRETAAFGSI